MFIFDDMDIPNIVDLYHLTVAGCFRSNCEGSLDNSIVQNRTFHPRSRVSCVYLIILKF